MKERLIDADAYAAEMKTRQDACKEILDAAKEDGNDEVYDRMNCAFGVFVEAKLTLDAMPTVDAVPVAVFDRIIEELELHMYRIEGQDDLLYPLTPRQMTMNSTFEIAIDVVERIRKEQTDFVPRKEDADGERKDGERRTDEQQSKG